MTNLENKANKMTTDILSSIRQENNPIKELLTVYIVNKLKETYNEGVKEAKNGCQF